MQINHQLTLVTGLPFSKVSKEVSDLLMQPSVEKYTISNEVNKHIVVCVVLWMPEDYLVEDN